jgi:hypothetical protein
MVKKPIAAMMKSAPYHSIALGHFDPNPAARIRPAHKTASTLDTRLTGTQNAFSRGSRNTRPPKMPVPWDKTPTASPQYQPGRSKKLVNPARSSTPASPPTVNAAIVTITSNAGADTSPSSTK